MIRLTGVAKAAKVEARKLSDREIRDSMKAQKKEDKRLKREAANNPAKEQRTAFFEARAVEANLLAARPEIRRTAARLTQTERKRRAGK